MAQPITVIEGFFAFKSLEHWLLTLQHWEEAALGNTSITKSEDAAELMPVMEWLYKITETAWLIGQLNITVRLVVLKRSYMKKVL